MSDARPVPMEELLVHRQWVRALARRLAADESSADDLEQSTWLAAIESPPADARSTRGWLGTVLRNLHRNSLRGDARRDRREEATPQRDPPRTADELVAEAETQHTLVREVLALDEPYRSTVLLRWYEDLTPTAIAGRTGVPVDTVKTRLRRAVDRLRERMDDRFHGDRRAWCLLAVGGDDGAGRGAATGTRTALTSAAGGVAMGTSTKLTIAAAALIALGVATWWSRSDGAPVAAPPRETAETALPASAPTAKPDRRADRTDEAATAVATGAAPATIDRDLDLHGLVVRADGSAVVGARVRAVAYPWRRTMTTNIASWFDAREGSSTTSSDAGSFALRLARGDATVVRVEADGLATREAGPFQAGERVRITMTAAVKLRVSLKDETGAPVTGAALWLIGFGRGDEPWVNARAVTDAEGRCVFEGLPGGAHVMLAPVRGVGDFGGSRAALPAEGEVSIDVVSPTGRTLRGRVFDAVTLAPLPGATVGVGPAAFCATTTDGGGRFELRGWTGQSGRDLLVTAAGYPRTVVPVAAEDSIDVPLSRGFAATGRVVDAAGRAVPGAYVAAEASRFEAGVSRSSSAYATTDEAGRFQVTGLDRGLTHSFSTFATGHGRVRRDVAPPGGDVESIDVGDLPLVAARTIGGRVIGPDGTPSPGVEVLLSGPGVSAAAENGGDVESRRTDDLGRFAFGDLAPGDYSVNAVIAQVPSAPARIALSADRDVLDVVLPPKATSVDLVVVVRDEAGAPLAGMNVLGDQRAVARTDASGRATLAAPASGRITRIDVGSQNPQDAYLRLPTILVEPGRHEYAVTLVKGVRVACRLLDADGVPVSRASVSVEPDDRAVAFSISDAEGRLGVTLPRDGEFSIVFGGGVYVGAKGLPTDSLLEARVDHVTAQSGEVTLRCRRVETGRTAAVRVLAADGSPVAGTEVRLFNSAGDQRKVLTDEKGRAGFDGLAAREYQASVEFKTGMLFPPPVKFVPAGQEVVLEYPAPVTIAGSVFLPGGAPAAGASVTALRGKPGVLVFTTNADRDGRFAVQIPAGDDGPFTLTVGAFVDKALCGAERALSPQDRDVRVDLTRR